MSDSNLVEYADGTPFPGKIGKTIDDSTEAWPMPPAAPSGAPNVLFYVLDDIGFGQLSPFGGLIPKPNLQRVADAGVLYTSFHHHGSQPSLERNGIHQRMVDRLSGLQRNDAAQRAP